MKKQVMFLLFLVGPIALMNMVWSIFRFDWLYWFSWSYFAWEIIVVGCLLIFVPKKVLEIGAFLKNTHPKPFVYWSEKHFTYIYLGIIVLGLGVSFFYLFIKAFITQPP